MRAQFQASLIALSLTCLVIVPCAEAQMRMRGTSKGGRVLYHSPAAGRNGLACIDCHADFDEKKLSDGKLRAGHALINAAKRKTYWGQDPEVDNLYPDIAHAAVVCVEEFMLNPDKLTSQQLLDLQSYLRNITRQPITAPLALAASADKTGEYGGFGGATRSLEEISFLQPATPVTRTAIPELRQHCPETGIPPSMPVRYGRATVSARSCPASIRTPTIRPRGSSCPSSASTA